MNGWWILVIVSAVVLIVGIILLCGAAVHGWWWGDIDVELVGIIITVLSGIIFLVFTLIAIIFPLNGKREYEAFLENRVIIEEVIDDSNGLENAGINNLIIETNKWLAEAKANKKVYGIFSSYYGLPIEEIEPIKINITANGDSSHDD